MYNVPHGAIPVVKIPSGKINICLLIGGEVLGGTYHETYRRWLEESLPLNSNVDFDLDTFDVMKQKFPLQADLDKYKAVIITGSHANAASFEKWVTHLILFIQEAISQHPNVKLYGNSFGHQIINRAIGGDVDANDDGLEIGLTPISSTYMGKLLFGVEEFNLIECHRDRVTLQSLGDFLANGGIYLLGSSIYTHNQGIVKFYPYPGGKQGRDRLGQDELVHRIHFFTMQGNPELTYDDLNQLVKGTKLEKRVPERPKITNNGPDVIGKTFWRMLGVKYPKEDCPATVPV